MNWFCSSFSKTLITLQFKRLLIIKRRHTPKRMENDQSELKKKINKERGQRNKLKLHKSLFILSDKGRIATKKKKSTQKPKKKTNKTIYPTKPCHIKETQPRALLQLCDCVGFYTSLDNVPDLLEIWTGLS